MELGRKDEELKKEEKRGDRGRRKERDLDKKGDKGGK